MTPENGEMGDEREIFVIIFGEIKQNSTFPSFELQLLHLIHCLFPINHYAIYQEG